MRLSEGEADIRALVTESKGGILSVRHCAFHPEIHPSPDIRTHRPPRMWPSTAARPAVSARMENIRPRMRHFGLLLVLFGLIGGRVGAQEPGGPPPPTSSRTDTGTAPYELLPDLGRIGAQVGFLGAMSWNPYSVGEGFAVGGYVDLPLFRAPGGRVSYEMLVSLSHGRSDPFTITDPIAYAANLATGASAADAPARPLPGAARRHDRPPPPAGLSLRPEVHDQVARPRPAPALLLRRARPRGGDQPPGPRGRREPPVHRHLAIRRPAHRRSRGPGPRARRPRSADGTGQPRDRGPRRPRARDPALPRALAEPGLPFHGRGRDHPEPPRGERGPRLPLVGRRGVHERGPGLRRGGHPGDRGVAAPPRDLGGPRVGPAPGEEPPPRPGAAPGDAGTPSPSPAPPPGRPSAGGRPEPALPRRPSHRAGGARACARRGPRRHRRRDRGGHAGPEHGRPLPSPHGHRPLDRVGGEPWLTSPAASS